MSNNSLLSGVYPVVSEVQFTPWGRGWHAWNSKAPECEFVDFVARCARLLNPRLIVETGMGSGSITRAILAAVDSPVRYYAYESSDWYLNEMQKDFSDSRLVLGNTIDWQLLRQADLTILDDLRDARLLQIAEWAAAAKPGAVCIVHDTSNRHTEGSQHQAYYDACAQLPDSFHKTWLHNPRGGCLLTKGESNA